MTTNPREVALRFYDLLNAHDLEGLRGIAAEDYVGHGFGDAGGPDALAADLGALVAAFPDVKVSVQRCIADGDHVAVQMQMTGTHLGDFAGFAASGNRIDVPSCDVMLVRGERVAEFWPLCDTARLFHQLSTTVATG